MNKYQEILMMQAQMTTLQSLNILLYTVQGMLHDALSENDEMSAELDKLTDLNTSIAKKLHKEAEREIRKATTTDPI